MTADITPSLSNALALDDMRDEHHVAGLSSSLTQEQAPNSNADSTPPNRLADFAMNQPSTRSIPIEADEDHEAKITSAIGLEHAHKLHDLWLAYQYDDVRDEMFQIRSADQQIRDLIDHALYSAIMMLQTEHVTVVGIILKLLYDIVENHPVLRKQILGPTLFYSRSSKEVQAEMIAVSKTLERLGREFAARRLAEAEGAL